MRLIGADSEQIGVVTLDEALQKAREAGLDLCEIASNAKPPVCKLMDFGKYKYERQKKAKEAKKKQKQVQVKEVKMRLRIDDHDYQVKLDRAQRFLEDGDKVKVTIMFRGRENAHPELGAKLLDRVVEDVSQFAQVERKPRKEGNQMFLVLGAV